VKKRRSKTKARHYRDADLDAYQLMVRSYVEAGVFTQQDLDDPEYIEYFISEDIREGFLKLVIDHRDDLLEEAKRYEKKGSQEYALLFYALFFEHSINGIISMAAKRKRLSDKSAKQLIRSANISSKFTWVLELLGLPPFNEKHLKCVMRTSDMRNAFVHYKFVGVRFDDENNEEGVTAHLSKVGKSATYMKKYESRFLYGGEKKKIKRKVKELSSDW